MELGTEFLKKRVTGFYGFHFIWVNIRGKGEGSSRARSLGDVVGWIGEVGTLDGEGLVTS